MPRWYEANASETFFLPGDLNKNLKIYSVASQNSTPRRTKSLLGGLRSREGTSSQTRVILGRRVHIQQPPCFEVLPATHVACS